MPLLLQDHDQPVRVHIRATRYFYDPANRADVIAATDGLTSISAAARDAFAMEKKKAEKRAAARAARQAAAERPHDDSPPSP